MICELDGYLAEEIEDLREAEEDRLALKAENLAKKHNWMTEKEWLLRLDNGSSQVSFSDQVKDEVLDSINKQQGDGKPSAEPTAEPATKPTDKKEKNK